MDLTALFSDDQIAVMGCFFALATCGLIVAASFRMGPAGKQRDSAGTASAGRIVPAAARATTSKSVDRKAA